jgi:hypothetical protein
MHAPSTTTPILLAAVLATISLGTVTLAQTSAAKPQRIRGQIVSLDGETLKVQSRTGETVGISVKPSVLITALKAIQSSHRLPPATPPEGLRQENTECIPAGGSSVLRAPPEPGDFFQVQRA